LKILVRIQVINRMPVPHPKKSRYFSFSEVFQKAIVAARF